MQVDFITLQLSGTGYLVLLQNLLHMVLGDNLINNSHSSSLYATHGLQINMCVHLFCVHEYVCICICTCMCDIMYLDIFVYILCICVFILMYECHVYLSLCVGV